MAVGAGRREAVGSPSHGRRARAGGVHAFGEKREGRGRVPPSWKRPATSGVDIDSVCGGRGLCGRCQVTQGAAVGIPSSRRVASRPPSALELGYRGRRRPLRDDHRLACAARLQGDAVIDVPPYSQVRRQVVRKRAEVVNIPVDPVVRLALSGGTTARHGYRQASDLSSSVVGPRGTMGDHRVVGRPPRAGRAAGRASGR